MFLKRRNVIAWALILLAAICWVSGRMMLEERLGGVLRETTAQAQQDMTSAPAHAPISGDPDRHLLDDPVQEDSDPGFTVGFILCFAAIALGAAAVFGLRQTAPGLGPDGAAMLLSLVWWGLYHWYWSGVGYEFFLRLFFAGSVLASLRETWGWVWSRLQLDWCIPRRIARRCPRPQHSLMVYVGWIVVALAGVVLACNLVWFEPVNLLCAVLVLGFGVGCLWKYGADLHHFQKQLDRWQQGLPITVGGGAFAKTEEQLLTVQARHEEAVRTAVTSERFRVDLIANVSHDLRTPLTSILGYGELLQKEALSPAGREQLGRLNQKAGYMRELVDSLFELTKISSGVAEAKREEIDLIRLLEQTIGLFDDQLTGAGLVVRRHYCAGSLPVVTDGARMHQVFANLLGNAIKYALAGTRIHLEVSEQDDHFRIRMVNTASYEMDFSPEEILQRFARGDKARSTQGSGLGLAIAQTYTESVGGGFTVAVDGDQFSAIVRLPKTERNL